MRRFLCLVIIGLLIVSVFGGCVRRKMTVGGTPGATVYLDRKEIGRTPFSTDFDHYGKREFRIVKQGYETKTELIHVRAPWYQWVGIDFVSEVLLPGKLTDHKHYEFELQPERFVPGSEIVSRAEALRQTAHADGVPRVGGTTTVSSAPTLAPTMPAETLPTPTTLPANPNTFVPPILQPNY
jgi:hypothetical protein